MRINKDFINRIIKFIICLNLLLLVFLAVIGSWEKNKLPYIEDEDSLSGRYIAAYYAQKHNKMHDAARLFHQALESNPNDRIILTNAFVSYLLIGQIDEALDIAKKYYNSDKITNITGNIIPAIQKIKQQKYSEASDLFKNNSNNSVSIIDYALNDFLFAWSKIAENKTDEAYNIIRSIKPSSETESFIDIQKALMLEFIGKNSEAEKIYNILQSNKELTYRISKLVANYFVRTNKLDKAVEIYDNYNKLNPVGENFAREINEINSGIIHKEKIIGNINQAISELLVEFANVLYNNFLYQQAIAYLQTALYLSPNFDEIYIMLALHYEVLGDYNEAIKYYRKISFNSNLYDFARANIAVNYNKLGETAIAKRIFYSLSNLKYVYALADLELAKLFRNDKDYESAELLYTRLIKRSCDIFPGHWIVFFDAGVNQDLAREHIKAEQYYIKAIELNPFNEAVINNLAYSWILLNKNLDKAINMLEGIIDGSSQHYVSDSLGWALYNKGEYEGAISYLEDAILTDPDNPIVNEHLGDAYFKVNKKYQAIYQWEKALKFYNEEIDIKRMKNKIKDVGEEV